MSTIKVDTYLTRGGASEIAIDKLKGASSAGSMTVVGEGGSTTTNLQQGLCKHWISVDMSSAAVLDSFNAGSITDNGTGDFTNTITSAMSNDDYSNTIGSLYVTAWGQIAFFRTGTARSTTVYRTGSVNYHNNGNATDSPQFDTQVNGDLA